MTRRTRLGIFFATVPLLGVVVFRGLSGLPDFGRYGHVYGDLLIVRTGHMSRYLDRNDWRHFDLDDSPGVSAHSAPWMHAREIAAIATPTQKGTW